MLIRCSGLTFSDTELPPQVPQPRVKATLRPVLIPVPPMLPPVLTRIREAGLAANRRTISRSLVCRLMVWPIPFWSRSMLSLQASSQSFTV